MIYVTNGNEVEALVQVSNFEMQQEIKGDFNISLVSHNTDRNPAHRILQEESVITIGDFDFRVKQLKETRRGKQVVAVNTFFDLIDTRKNEIYGGTRTFNEFLTFVLGGTAWRFTFDSDLNDHRLIANFGDNNIIALINALCQVYECEYVILPNNHIHFAKQIGGDYDAQYRYGYNVKALSKNVDTTKLKTYIEGFGADNLWVSYTSPNELKFGKREADPIYDDRYTNSDSLVERIKSELIDYPEATFELDSIELLDKELGERVWLIYEPLDMEFQTRILSQTKQFVNGELRTTKVVLGNTLPKTTTDILISQKVEIDENKKITRSKFEQTNNQITMAVETIGESIAELKLTDKEINLRVEETNKNLAEFKITAQQISTRIENKVDNLNSEFVQTSNEFRTSINDNGRAISTMRQDLTGFEFTVNSRFNDTNSKITQTENQIRFEVVKKDEYNGRTITSMINQDPYAVSISADKINLNGAVMVNGTISGATSIQVNDNVKVGNYLTIGDYYNADYAIYFGGSAKAMSINGTSSDTIQLSAMNGVSIPSGYLYVGGRSVLLTNTSGLRLDWNSSSGGTDGGRLYVRTEYGEVGYIPILK
ncbi:phage tail protein [Lysinibacillus sp. NPDC086135]|uniref:phage tail protein n=1 Tax=Lysinibacillus sp. NPDC086135 TaxID=3364130 RepID=UPI003816DA02